MAAKFSACGFTQRAPVIAPIEKMNPISTSRPAPRRVGGGSTMTKRIAPSSPSSRAPVASQTVQTCIVHLLRHSLDFTAYKDRKPVATALKDIYRATDAAAAEKALTAFEASEWGRRYAAIGQSWRRAWSEVVPFYAFPEGVRKIVYTTNAIEALNSKLRRAVRARGHFPTDDAALKLLFLICS